MTVTAQSLFQTYFSPLYPIDCRDLERVRSLDVNPARNPSLVRNLDEAADVFVKLAAPTLGLAPEELRLDGSDASVHRLSAALSPITRDRLMTSGAAGTPDSSLFQIVVHGAAYVGACVVRRGGEWIVRRPLWESSVALKSRAGEATLSIFLWWLRSLEDDASTTLADRYRTYVEVPCADVEDLPVIACRDLPPLARPTYSALHRYLRAHLPELHDVGDAFPSAERWDEWRLGRLEFLLVGEGRMLVAYGASMHGLHALWFTRAGFEKSAFWPCDAFPAPLVRRTDDMLEIVLSKDGKTQRFQVLWWGP